MQINTHVFSMWWVGLHMNKPSPEYDHTFAFLVTSQPSTDNSIVLFVNSHPVKSLKAAKNIENCSIKLEGPWEEDQERGNLYTNQWLLMMTIWLFLFALLIMCYWYQWITSISDVFNTLNVLWLVEPLSVEKPLTGLADHIVLQWAIPSPIQAVVTQ